jgi:signal transduction histidine kinase
MSNAIKYRHPDRTPHIIAKSFFKGENKMFTVQDNGLGIDLTRHRDKVFGMYKTFHQHPDARGIGLFITKNQIEALGGTITVASEPGQGTTFTIQF